MRLSLKAIKILLFINLSFSLTAITVKAESFVAPNQFSTAFHTAYANGYDDSATALINTYPKITNFFLTNATEVGLSIGEFKYMNKLSKLERPNLSDSSIKQLLHGKWASSNKNINVNYNQDGTGVVIYKSTNARYDFTWGVINGSVNFIFGNEKATDQIININKKHYLFKSNESGELKYLYRK